MGLVMGYARVSTDEQDTALQLDTLRRAGVDRIYEDKASGIGRRAQLGVLLDQLRPDDLVVVYKLDRVARSLADLLAILDRIERAGARFKSLTETIDTTTPAGRMLMQLLGAFAEFERGMIVERTRAGVRAARDRGVRIGRPRAMTPSEERECVEMHARGTHTLSSLARRYGCHVASVKRALSRARQAV